MLFCSSLKNVIFDLFIDPSRLNLDFNALIFDSPVIASVRSETQSLKLNYSDIAESPEWLFPSAFVDKFKKLHE